MYARIRDGIVTELCPVNPSDIFCRELADSFYLCGEELVAGEMAVVKDGVLYRDTQSMAEREEKERARAALAETVNNIKRENELRSMLQLLIISGLSVEDIYTESEARLGNSVHVLCEILGTDISSGRPTFEGIEKIREALYHGGN